MSQNEEFMISGNEDNIVAYRIVHVPDSPKATHTIHATPVNSAVTTSVPQQMQYIVIDSSNGFLQAVPATQLTTVPNTTLKIEQSQASSNSNAFKIRSSVAIAPKIENVGPYSTSSASTNNLNKSNVNLFFVII